MNTPTATDFTTELRLRASVLVHFAVDWLGLDIEKHLDEFDRFMLIDVDRAQVESSRSARWRVTEDVRRFAALQGATALRSAWAAVTERPDTPEQRVLDTVIGRGEPVRLKDASPDELQAIALVSRWFEGVGPPVPTLLQVNRHVDFEGLLDPLRKVATEFFRDRADELAALQRGTDGRPILLIGRGGIGKSALLARHLLDSVNRDVLICYLNFDHSALDPLAPSSLVAAIARQLSWQFDDERASRLRELAEGAREAIRRDSSASSTASRSLSVDAHKYPSLLADIGRAVHGHRVEIVFDTLEEAQRRDWDLRSLRQLFDACLEEISGARLVAGGRADVRELDVHRITLEGLPRDDAVHLLHILLQETGQGTPRQVERHEVERVVDMIGTSPLCVRLAAGLLKSAPDDDQPLADLDMQEGLLEGELYRRLLGHIENDDVRKLAYPGLTLRRITPHIITHVLAGPCGVEVDGPDRARELFNGLASEAMLVDREADDVLLHRSDIRPLMLERLERDHEVDVKRIHRSAITYYKDQPSVDDRVEELYHRLMLEQSSRTVDQHWDAEAAHGLHAAADDLPASGRAYLLAKAPQLETYFDPDEIARLDAERARPVLQRRVERLVATGEVAEAADLLAAARTIDGAPELPLLELQVREMLGDFDGAADIAAAEEQRLAEAGDVAAGIEVAMHRARIWQRMGEVERGARHLDHLHDRHRLTRSRAVDDLLQLRLTVARLRLDRFGGGGTDRAQLVKEAIVLFDSVPRGTLVQNSSLLRDLTGELGTDAPARCLALALETGVLEDPDGTIATGLAEFDKEVSDRRGGDHVLADVAEVDADLDGPVDWERWMEQEQSTKVATKVGSLIREFETDMPSSFRESIAKQYRDASDGAHEFEVEP